MNLNNLKKNFFEDGYVFLDPGELISDELLNQIQKEADQILPSYNDGEVDPKKNNSRTDPRFFHSNKIGDISYHGCPLKHRYRIGYGSADILNDTNYLYGRRAILPERAFSSNLINVIENKIFLNILSEIYETDSNNLSFHNGSLSRVYPGCTGESGKVHIDTPGFVREKRKKLTSNKFLINIFCFLTDITEDLAPMSIIPASHKKYEIINKALAQSFKGNPKKNNVTQAGHIYDELIEDLELNKKITLTGKAGSVVLMNSSLIHAATENFTKNNYRDVLILNYSKKTDFEFRKKYFLESKKESQKLFTSAKNKQLFERSFNLNLKNYLHEYTLKRLIITNINKINSTKKITKDILYPYYKAAQRLLHKKTSQKKYINIGAGNGWRHKDFLSLDLADDIEINFNLNKEKKLPFKDESMNGVYSSHCFEHLRIFEVKHWLNECFRVLNKKSIVRFVVPDIMLYFEAYEKKDASFFDWIRSSGSYSYDSWLRSIVRQFASPVVDKYSDKEIYDLYKRYSLIEFLDFFEKKVNEITDEKYLWPQIHKSWWSKDRFAAELRLAGFKKINHVSQNQSSNNIFLGKSFNTTRPHMSLFIEGIK